MKLHVSACNGHRQVSTTIKKSLYICVKAIAPLEGCKIQTHNGL